MSCSDKANTCSISFDQEGLVCYCFKYSKKELFNAIQSEKDQEIVSEIKAKMKDPGCFCEKANPSGSCCISDLKAYISYFKALR